MSAPSTDSDFGTNSWLVEEMYEQFREDPDSVGEAWQEFFADYKSTNPALQAHASAPTPDELDDEPVAPAASSTANGATTTAPAAPPAPAALPPRPAARALTQSRIDRKTSFMRCNTMILSGCG